MKMECSIKTSSLKHINQVAKYSESPKEKLKMFLLTTVIITLVITHGFIQWQFDKINNKVARQSDKIRLLKENLEGPQNQLRKYEKPKYTDHKYAEDEITRLILGERPTNFSSGTPVRVRRTDVKEDHRPTQDRRYVRGGRVVHMEVDSTIYSMDVEHAGTALNIWSLRNERRQANFGIYENNGYFRIIKRGLYLIYSQMTYHDNTGRWCHTISKNDRILVKCLAVKWRMNIDDSTVDNCFTSIVVYLRTEDRLFISSLYPNRAIHHDSSMSFWGIAVM